MSRSTCPTPALVGSQMMNFNNQTTNQIDNSSRIRLSGAARKRFYYWLKMGMDPEEAKKQAMLPMRLAKELRKERNAQYQIASGMNCSNKYDSPDSGWQTRAETFQSADPAQVPGGPNPRNDQFISQSKDSHAGNSGLWGTGLTESNASYVNVSEKLSAGGSENASFSGYAYFGSEMNNHTNKHPQEWDRTPVQARLGAAVKRFTKEVAPVQMDPIITNVPSPRRPTEHDSELCDDLSRCVAILPGDYPTELWTRNQLKAVKKSIIDLVQRQSDSSINENSFQYIFRKGWLCVKGHATNWLMAMDTRLRPWEGASLKVVPESQVPLNRTFIGHFPALHSTSVKYTLRLIDIHNEGVAAYDWLVLQRDQSGPTMKLTLSIDAQSAEVLRSRRYQLNFGFSQVKLLPSQINS